MSGTVEGGRRAAQTQRERLGDAEYKRRRSEGGRKGGSVRNPNKGFGKLTPEQVRELGAKGGRNSRRG